MGYFNEFPHTRGYDGDLGYLIKVYKELYEKYLSNNEYLQKIFDEIETVTVDKLEEWLADGTLTQLVEEAIAEINTLLKNNLKIVTPEYFGCVGDGQTDDTTNFQKAIDYVEENEDFTLLLTKKYKVTNLLINKYCAINFNNRPLIGYSTSGILLDINIPYTYDPSQGVDANPFYKWDNFENILINGNSNTNYQYLVRFRARNLYINSLTIINGASDGVINDEKDGLCIDYLFIRGDGASNPTLDNKGLILATSDSIINNLEVAYYNTCIYYQNTTNYIINNAHLWNDKDFNKNIGIYCANGWGLNINNLILDSLKTGIQIDPSAENGSPSFISNVQFLNVAEINGTLFGTGTPKQLSMISIGSLRTSNTTGDNFTSGSRWENMARIFNNDFSFMHGLSVTKANFTNPLYILINGNYFAFNASRYVYNLTSNTTTIDIDFSDIFGTGGGLIPVELSTPNPILIEGKTNTSLTYTGFYYFDTNYHLIIKSPFELPENEYYLTFMGKNYIYSY